LRKKINYTESGGSPVPQLGLTGVPLSGFPDINTSNYIDLGASYAFHDPFEATELLRAQFRERGETV
jgi:hypothetical protein